MMRILLKFTGISDEQVNWGGNEDPRKFLSVGDIREMVKYRQHSWHTKIWLREPDGSIIGPFNSGGFKVDE
jgi:hypothetical protein